MKSSGGHVLPLSPFPTFSFSRSAMSVEIQTTANDKALSIVDSSDCIPVKVEFTGGLELLFSNQRSHHVSLPTSVPVAEQASASEGHTDEQNETKPVDVNYLLRYLRDNLLKERVELFMENDTM